MKLTRTFYEIDLLRYIRFVTTNHHRSGTVSIDVGANIGNHTVYFGAFISRTVIAIEPNARTIPTLQRNLARNRGDWIICKCAVGATVGPGRIALPCGADNNVGMATIERISDAGVHGAVPIKTLDDIIDVHLNGGHALSRINVVKIDVEGMELEAVKGAKNMLTTFRPHLFIEAATPSAFDELEAYLSPFGYRAVSRWAATPVYHFAPSPSIYMIVKVRAYRLLVLSRKVSARLARLIASFKSTDYLVCL